jgi:hypothetical protein
VRDTRIVGHKRINENKKTPQEENLLFLSYGTLIDGYVHISRTWNGGNSGSITEEQYHSSGEPETCRELEQGLECRVG